MMVTSLKYRITVRFVQIQAIMQTEDVTVTAVTDLILSQKEKRFDFSVSHSETPLSQFWKKNGKDKSGGQIRFKMRLSLVKCVPS